MADIAQEADPVALVEPARDLGDVGGGVAVAEERLQRLLAPLGQDLAMALLVEAVDHDPVVAGQLLEDPGGVVAQATQRHGAQDRLDAGLDMAAQVDRRAGALELDHQAAGGRAMQQPVVRGERPAHPAAHRHRDGMERVVDQMGLDAGGQIAGQPGQRPAQHLGLVQEFGGIGACLDHQLISLADHQEGAMGLDRAGQMDLLALAIRQVGLAESGCRRRTCSHTKISPISRWGLDCPVAARPGRSD